MALLALPNPKKSTQVDFPIERVKLSVLNISLINSKYKFTSSNEIFNQYTYHALELLNIGVYIDINLNRVSDSATEITVEIRRKIGTFNEAHVVTKAHDHLAKIFDCIARLTAMSPEEIERVKNQQVLNKANSKNSNGTSSKWYDKKPLVYLLCVFIFPVGLYGLWKSTVIAKGWKIAVTLLISFIVIANLLPDSKKQAKAANSSEVTAEEPASNWNFSEEVDKMTSQKIKYAWVDANEKLTFTFPYNGGSVASLTIRKQDGTDNLSLSVSKGQFNKTFGGGHVRIKFDQDAPGEYAFVPSSDSSTNVIFITPAPAIIARLKASKTIIIETEFFREGIRQIEFNTAGLKWE